MLKNVLEKGKKGMKAVMANVVAIFYMVMLYSNSALAIQNSIYVTGTKKLLKDGLTAAQAVAAGLVLVLWVIWELKKRAGEENEEPQYSKKQKSAIIGLIIVETIATFFGVIGGYYGITIS